MKNPLLISFHNMRPSATIEKTVRKKAARLNLFYNRITSCRVTIEGPHRHHRKGNIFPVRIDLSLPGREIVITRPLNHSNAFPAADYWGEAKAETESRYSTKSGTHEDAYVAIREVFDAAVRRLHHYIGRRRARVRNKKIELPAES